MPVMVMCSNEARKLMTYPYFVIFVMNKTALLLADLSAGGDTGGESAPRRFACLLYIVYCWDQRVGPGEGFASSIHMHLTRGLSHLVFCHVLAIGELTSFRERRTRNGEFKRKRSLGAWMPSNGKVAESGLGERRFLPSVKQYNKFDVRFRF